MFKRIATSALVLGMAATAPPAARAMPLCALRADIVETLTEKRQEVRTAGGLRSEEQLMEIWTSVDTGTWTVLMTHSNGVSCIMAHGDHWMQHPRPAPGAQG